MEANQLLTFGDTRRLMLDTIVELKSGRMEATRGMALAAMFKVLNDNVQVEVNATKMALLTENKAHSFGRVIGMGQRLIGNSGSQSA